MTVNEELRRAALSLSHSVIIFLMAQTKAFAIILDYSFSFIPLIQNISEFYGQFLSYIP